MEATQSFGDLFTFFWGLIDYILIQGFQWKNPLTFMTFLPAIAAIAFIFVPSNSKAFFRWATVAVCAVVLVRASFFFLEYTNAQEAMNAVQGAEVPAELREGFGVQRLPEQAGAPSADNWVMYFVERAPWIVLQESSDRDPYLNIEYFMGVDGLSVALVLLTAFISFLAAFTSFGIEKKVKGYFIMFLLLQAGMTGVFCSLDFFLFYVFWEVMLLPMYFLIGIWGGDRREYAAIKFFIYTFAGSVLMLLAILALFFKSGGFSGGTLDMLRLAQMGRDGLFSPEHWEYSKLVWWGLFIAFLVKVPGVPVHTWLPDAHVQAPTAISVILAGVLLKMGGYGIMRINLMIMPDASSHFAYVMAGLGALSIVWGGLAAFHQKDFKKLVAYSSVASMGYVLLGIAAMTPTSMTGAIFHMVNHGFYSAALFMLVGVVYDRAHTREIEKLGGFALVMPHYTGAAGLVFMAALGLPGLAVFISEAMVLLGSFDAFPWHVVIGGTGIIITASYLLWTMQRIFLGTIKNEEHSHFPDLTLRERVTIYPLCACLFFFGFYPKPVLDLMTTSVEALQTWLGVHI